MPPAKFLPSSSRNHSRARLDTRVYVVADSFDDDPNLDLSHTALASEVTSRSLDQWLGRVRPARLALDSSDVAGLGR